MIWRCGSFRFDLTNDNGLPLPSPLPIPLLMGILNVTPDSFSDADQFASDQAAIDYGLKLGAEGAYIIDVGGESTRPKHTAVPVLEELVRISAVVKGLCKHGLCVSIDTHKPAVMAHALAAGAAIINDVNGFHDPEALYLTQRSECGIVVMDGFSTQDQSSKRAGIGLVQRMAARYAALIAVGIDPGRIVIDPGIGFDKTFDENVDCIKLLPQLRLIAPVLIGISRKSVLGTITQQNVGQRLSASVAAALVAAQNGAAVLRVHDVQATQDALKVWRAFSD